MLVNNLFLLLFRQPFNFHLQLPGGENFRPVIIYNKYSYLFKHNAENQQKNTLQHMSNKNKNSNYNNEFLRYSKTKRNFILNGLLLIEKSKTFLKSSYSRKNTLKKQALNSMPVDAVY